MRLEFRRFKAHHRPVDSRYTITETQLIYSPSRMIQTPKRKVITQPTYHLAHRHSTSLSHTLTDTVLSYVIWYLEVVKVLDHSPYNGMMVLDLPPVDPTDSMYERKLANARKNCKIDLSRNLVCAENGLLNSRINQVLRESLDLSLRHMASNEMACENMEAIKAHFASMMNPFAFYTIESSLVFDSDRLLYFFRLLDVMVKFYFHIFRFYPTDDLIVLWIMTSLNKSSAEPELRLEIQRNWTHLYNCPDKLRALLNEHLHHQVFSRRYEHFMVSRTDCTR